MRTRVRTIALLVILGAVITEFVPLFRAPMPHAVVRTDGGVVERCLVRVHSADDDPWASYPDTLHLQSRVLPQHDSLARVLADASTGERDEYWLPLAGDSVELRGHHRPTVRLSGGAAPTGIAYPTHKLSVRGWLWARLGRGGAEVSAREVECPTSTERAS